MPWVRSALREALEHAIGNVPLRLRPSSESEAETLDQVHARAVRETTARVVHELSAIVGTARLYAQDEVTKYDSSRTKRELDRLSAALRALDALGQAAGVPVSEEFDLGLLLDDLGAAVSQGTGVKVATAGSIPTTIRSDRGLVDLVVRNAVVNAAEASRTTGTGVLVNWGISDRDHWVTVLDEGSGLPPEVPQLFEIGATTKDGHIGMGLATAQTAARSLGGSIELSNRDARGARFVFRWPRGRENS